MMIVRLGFVLFRLEVRVVVVRHVEVAVLERRRLQRLFPPRVVLDILGQLAILAEPQGVGLRRGRYGQGHGVGGHGCC